MQEESRAVEGIDAPHAIHTTLNYPTAGCRPADEKEEEEAEEEVSGEVGWGAGRWGLVFNGSSRFHRGKTLRRRANAASCSSPPPPPSPSRDGKDVEKKGGKEKGKDGGRTDGEQAAAQKVGRRKRRREKM